VKRKIVNVNFQEFRYKQTSADSACMYKDIAAFVSHVHVWVDRWDLL